MVSTGPSAHASRWHERSFLRLTLCILKMVSLSRSVAGSIYCWGWINHKISAVIRPSSRTKKAWCVDHVDFILDLCRQIEETFCIPYDRLDKLFINARVLDVQKPNIKQSSL